ncbi:MAG: repressor LexA [Blastocatellia bacterium AA13]|nr:MAG: repressor LexA [Blastocatellia bacterium AA13]
MRKEQLTQRESEALRHIRTAIIHAGKPPSIRDIQTALGYSSPRSAAVIINSLIEKGFVDRRENGGLRIIKDLPEREHHGRTVDIPLVGSAPCGLPVLAQENIEAVIPVSKSIARPGHRYFLLKARGTSMDKAGIKDGDLVLVRQQSTATNGDIVVALIDDHAVIKEFHRFPTTVVLKPKSSSKEHQPIILHGDFQVQGIVVATIPKF